DAGEARTNLFGRAAARIQSARNVPVDAMIGGIQRGRAGSARVAHGQSCGIGGLDIGDVIGRAEDLHQIEVPAATTGQRYVRGVGGRHLQRGGRFGVGRARCWLRQEVTVGGAVGKAAFAHVGRLRAVGDGVEDR